MIINTEEAILTKIYVKLPKKTERFLLFPFPLSH